MAPFRYILEVYAEAGAVPGLDSEDCFFRLESTAPFPQPEVGERASVLTTQNQGIDHWTVKRRGFIYWDTGSTTQLWCAPKHNGGEGP